ncbi:tRNA (adenosine(37)-N6)-dimethylallyltransferase MiaA [Enterobacteriaceae endosymbiont of Neohaemonia nigricornis]|uniref:tRNA (adenosine(37)-N6)-dimethylallyltransferase MiaA n=1 Tax=Enterobacteriaceae endosymbiont of Neohaemonia nigricornis TaxID=2675792 RepID=UPI001449263C|nr:tRNA (adenosine(37)-N6)-dimethylallyltransferase MiaA [Enterobacteriaceae endosymbiont of Neohaemonia nigricornis]QJC30369.1 tRNA (adenosine(37)-N6)-dimethylallyltransferase MiaA [Enterobacteriaceae endosymbiont of Neohaemonia nigricornis]
MNNKLPIAIFLMGTTASKKTHIAMKLAHVLPIELISVDSALIYKKLNIGTAKPNKNHQFYSKHWLIDIKEPYQKYSVYDFYQDTINIMCNITKKGKIPLLVGGTIFYYHRLMNAMSPLPKSNQYIRNIIFQQIKNKKFSSYHNMLCQIDPISAKRIHFNDTKRIIRAIEIFFITGKTLSTLIKTPGPILPYYIYQFALTYFNRDQLFQSITQRIMDMIDLGFESEVRYLINNQYLKEDYPAMHCIGYKQMLYYIQNKINFSNMINDIIKMTKYLSKKQITWLKKINNIQWFDSTYENKIYDTIIKLVKNSIYK